MKYMVTYDLMESMRLTNQWLGATAQAFGAHPAVAMAPNPMFRMLDAWGQVTERTFSRMVAKPDWNIPSVVGEDGRDHPQTMPLLKWDDRLFLLFAHAPYRYLTNFHKSKPIAYSNREIATVYLPLFEK